MKTHPQTKRDTNVSCGIVQDTKEASAAKEAIRKLVTPVFEKALKETKNNRMSGGSGPSELVGIVYYQPHNYKLWFDYSKVSANLPPDEKTIKSLYTRGRVPSGRVFKLINYGKEISFPDFMGCRIVVHKKTIEIVNKINHKMWHPIRITDPDLIEARIEEIVVMKDRECREVLKEFIAAFGGSSNFEVVNTHGEHKVAGEDKINLISSKLRFHGDVAKKVYGEKNVEFKTAAYASNYLTNRSLENLSPVLAEEMRLIREQLASSKEFVSTIESIKLSINNFPEDVFKVSNQISALRDFDKVVLTSWLFEKFGVGV